MVSPTTVPHWEGQDLLGLHFVVALDRLHGEVGKSCQLTSGEYYVLELDTNAMYLVRTIRILVWEVRLTAGKGILWFMGKTALKPTLSRVELKHMQTSCLPYTHPHMAVMGLIH